MTAPILPSGRRPNTPGGLYYDGETKDFKRDSYGQLRSIHYVDEGMAMSLCVEKGSIKSASDTGNALRTIKYLGTPTLADEVKAMVLSAQPLARLVSEGKALVTAIDVQTSGSTMCVSVYYVNLLTADPRNLKSHERRLEWYT